MARAGVGEVAVDRLDLARRLKGAALEPFGARFTAKGETFMINYWRDWSLTSLMLIGLMGVSLSLASVAVAQDAGEESDSTTPVAADAGDETPAAMPDEAATPDEAEGEAPAEEAEAGLGNIADVDQSTSTYYTINTLVMFICAVLVIFMQAGFAMVEVGMNSAKNAVNILAKNVMDISVGV